MTQNPRADKILEVLWDAEGPLFAQEIATHIGCTREEALECLEGPIQHYVTSDGYCWAALPSPESNSAYTRLSGLLETRRWSEFDAQMKKTQLRGKRRTSLLERKAQKITASLPPNIRPDSSQAWVLASSADTIRVVARAGSGKTRMLHALTHFLVSECGVAPNEVLLLAFNRNAAEQLEAGLANSLRLAAFPGARTFHSLAYGIAQPEEALVMDAGREVSAMHLTKLVQGVLTASLDDTLRSEIYQLFRSETKRDLATGALLSGESYYAFRRDLEEVTLNGTSVKSAGEKYIGDFLFEHGVEWYYEERFRWKGGWYRPDFKIKTGSSYIILEHWAINPEQENLSPSRGWTLSRLREYQEEAREKRSYWKDKGVPLIETCAQECRNREQFEEILKARLLPYCGRLERLPQSVLFESVVRIHLSILAQLLAQAIQRVQKRGMDGGALEIALDAYVPGTEREALFLRLLRKTFESYGHALERDKKVDFDRLFNRALALMSANPPQTVVIGKKLNLDLRSLKFCLVDEAQDLSPQFVAALHCIRSLNPSIRLVFVGDDWQAINRFAGSSVELFTHGIATRFGECETNVLKTNYRSRSRIVQAGNALMRGRGEPGVASNNESARIERAFYDGVWVEFREEAEQYETDAPFRAIGNGVAAALLKALYQLCLPDLLAGKSVGVLFRTNYFGPPIDEMHEVLITAFRAAGWPSKIVDHWRDAGLTFSTAHRFKGDQRQTIFIVAPHAGNFPLVKASSIELFRFFGDSIAEAEEDERRLFYVALTRAKERLVFLCERSALTESPFLEPIQSLVTDIEIPTQLIRPEAPQNLSLSQETSGNLGA